MLSNKVYKKKSIGTFVTVYNNIVKKKQKKMRVKYFLPCFRSSNNQVEVVDLSVVKITHVDENLHEKKDLKLQQDVIEKKNEDVDNLYWLQFAAAISGKFTNSLSRYI